VILIKHTDHVSGTAAVYVLFVLIKRKLISSRQQRTMREHNFSDKNNYPRNIPTIVRGNVHNFRACFWRAVSERDG